MNPEKAKYEQMWGFPEYRQYAPGEHLAAEFLKHTTPPVGAEIIDFGAGTGRGALSLARQGYSVTMLDFAKNCSDPHVAAAVESGELKFIEHDLLTPAPVKAEYGYCTDVMEHIHPNDVDAVLDNVLDAAAKVFFQISLQHDACGALIGEHLHLTVQSMEWWSAKLRNHNAFVYYSEKNGENAIFYVSKIQGQPELLLNVELDKIVANIVENTSMGYQQLVPHVVSNKRLMLLAGGPSLNDYVEEIRRKSAAMPVICTNGTYAWCLENKITPKALIVVDARPSNKKFVSEVIPGCKYMFASQCHPSLFEGIPSDQVYLWHSHLGGGIDAVMDTVLDEAYGEEPWYSVPGGTTVTLRAIPLLGMLGWKKIDVYGFDSCLREGEHHAYKQNENDGQIINDVVVKGRSFKCHPWMVTQSHQFDMLYTAIRGNIHLRIFGDGLISTLAAMIDSKKRSTQ